MLTRLIPILQLLDGCLVKTKMFSKPDYIGDPVNTANIFNELAVDEIVVLDINCTYTQGVIDYSCIKLLAEQCFMPLTYGGGVAQLDDASRIFDLGVEKISLNSALHNSPDLVEQLVRKFGSQAIVASVDVKKNYLGKYCVYSRKGSARVAGDLLSHTTYIEKLGVGEILLTNIDREGSWSGIDLELTKLVVNNVDVPVISNGGYSGFAEFQKINDKKICSAVGGGSAFFYQKKDFGVLVNYPNLDQLRIRDI